MKLVFWFQNQPKTLCVVLTEYRLESWLDSDQSVDGCCSPCLPPVVFVFQTSIELFVNRLDSVESVLPYEYTA